MLNTMKRINGLRRKRLSYRSMVSVLKWKTTERRTSFWELWSILSLICAEYVKIYHHQQYWYFYVWYKLNNYEISQRLLISPGCFQDAYSSPILLWLKLSGPFSSCKSLWRRPSSSYQSLLLSVSKTLFWGQQLQLWGSRAKNLRAY